MKNKFYLIVSFLLLEQFFSTGLCQTNTTKDDNQKLYNHCITTGLNYSWLKCNTGNFGLYNYETNLGYSLNHYFSKKINIQIQALAGIKIKKPYDFRFDSDGKRTYKDNYDDREYVLFIIDEFDKLLSINHYYFELPVSLGYWIIPKLELRAGYSYRYYFGTSDNTYDFFLNNHESAILGGMDFKISKKVNVGSTFFLSSTKIYSSTGFVNGTQYNTTLKSRYIQIAIKYSFK